MNQLRICTQTISKTIEHPENIVLGSFDGIYFGIAYQTAVTSVFLLCFQKERQHHVT